MAIAKNIEQKIGFPATHWKATSVIIDYLNMRAQSTCLGYLSEQAMDDPEGQHVDEDTITIDLFWNQEDIDATKPQKTQRQTELEEKSDRTEEEEQELEELKNILLAQEEYWNSAINRQVVNEELFNAFKVLLKYQHLFHLQGKKLAGGSIIPDKLEDHD